MNVGGGGGGYSFVSWIGEIVTETERELSALCQWFLMVVSVWSVWCGLKQFPALDVVKWKRESLVHCVLRVKLFGRDKENLKIAL